MIDTEYMEALNNPDKYDAYIVKHLPIVRGIASSYSKYGEYSDLLQEGSIGLLIAFTKFKPEKGVPFKHYCRYWIRNKIQDFLWKSIPVRVTRDQFLQGDTPSNSGDEPLPYIPSEIESPEHYAEIELLKEFVRNAIKDLPEKEQSIVRMYFGIEHTPMSYQRIGDKLGYSKQRIQQLIVKILDVLKGKIVKWKS